MSTLVLAEAGTEARWEIRFEPEQAWFTPPDGSGEAFALSHAAFAKNVVITRAPKGCRLAVRTPDGVRRAFAYPFLLDLPVRAWMRRQLEVHAAAALARRVRLGVPIGVALIAAAIPWGGAIAPARPWVLGGLALIGAYVALRSFEEWRFFRGFRGVTSSTTSAREK